MEKKEIKKSSEMNTLPKIQVEYMYLDEDERYIFGSDYYIRESLLSQLKENFRVFEESINNSQLQCLPIEIRDIIYNYYIDISEIESQVKSIQNIELEKRKNNRKSIPQVYYDDGFLFF